MARVDADWFFAREPTYDPEITQKMRATFELYEFAEEVMRLNLRRRYPEAGEEEIERRLLSWLRKESIPE
jgi:hypothetical protein